MSTYRQAAGGFRPHCRVGIMVQDQQLKRGRAAGQ